MINQTDAIADMSTRAEAVGKRLYQVCELAGVAPSTYYRWLKGMPANVKTLNRIDEMLRRLERKAARS